MYLTSFTPMDSNYFIDIDIETELDNNQFFFFKYTFK